MFCVIFNPKIYKADFGPLYRALKRGFREEKKLQYNFPKMRGGSEAVGFFPKNHPFWYRHPSLRQGGEGCGRKLIDREVIAFFFSNVISSAVLLSIIHEGKVKTLPNAQQTPELSFITKVITLSNIKIQLQNLCQASASESRQSFSFKTLRKKFSFKVLTEN